jgi:hypothetical protein
MQAVRPDQLEICLIGEGRGFQDVIAGAAAEVMPRNPAQLRLNHGHDFGERLLVALAPGHEHTADIHWMLRHSGPKFYHTLLWGPRKKISGA